MIDEGVYYRTIDKFLIDDGCWLWTAARTSGGYGTINIGDHQMRHAHRIVYEIFVGPIPDGMDLDHLCRVRHCVRPSHLEPVTRRENVLRGIGRSAEQARQTHCKRGHEFNEENTYYYAPLRKRICRLCSNDRRREHRARQQ